MEHVDARIPQIAERDAPSNTAEAAPGRVLDRSGANSGSLAQVCESLLVTILLALFVTTFVLQAYKIPSDSMEPTLLVGDHVLVNKFVFEGNGAWYEKLLPYRQIRRGDVIIFKYGYEDHPDYVKRVIGLPGDHLHILAGRVYVNGKPLQEPYAVHEEPDDPANQEYFPPLDPYSARTQLLPEWAHDISNYVRDDELVVPPDHYFVMGDNRDDSLDSRYWGFVDRGAVMGKPIVIYWSVDATADDYADRSLLGTIEGIGETLVHLPSRTRWHRLLREVH